MRTRFDQFAKSLLDKVLSRVGEVRTQVEILGEVQAADVLFLPTREREAERTRLGLLGRMAETACLLEPFSSAPGADAALDCLTKQLTLRRNLVREARKGERRPEIPRLWILSAGRPNAVLEGLGFSPLSGWPTGVWQAAPLLSMHLIVLCDLPETRDTLALRLMGAGASLRRAIDELNALPEAEWEPRTLIPLLLVNRIQIPQNQKHQQNAREGNMGHYAEEADAIYAKWERRVFEQGFEKGAEKVLRGALMDLYEARFDAVPEALRAIIDATQDVSTLRSWVTLFGKATADEIAATLLANQSGAGAPR